MPTTFCGFTNVPVDALLIDMPCAEMSVRPVSRMSNTSWGSIPGAAAIAQVWPEKSKLIEACGLKNSPSGVQAPSGVPPVLVSAADVVGGAPDELEPVLGVSVVSSEFDVEDVDASASPVEPSGVPDVAAVVVGVVVGESSSPQPSPASVRSGSSTRSFDVGTMVIMRAASELRQTAASSSQRASMSRA